MKWHELIVLPSSPTRGRGPVAAILHWRRAAGSDTGPLLRGLTRSGQPRPTRLNDASINRIVKNAVARTGATPAE